MINKDHQKQEFQGRLDRIRSGGPNMLGQVYVGPVDEEEVRPTKERRKGPAGPRWFSLLLAFPIGAACYLIGSMIQYHVLAADGLYPLAQFGPMAEMISVQFGDLIPAAFLLLIFALILRFRSPACWTVATAGLFVMMGATQPLIATMPDVYQTLFSQEYVAGFVATGGITSAAF